MHTRTARWLKSLSLILLAGVSVGTWSCGRRAIEQREPRPGAMGAIAKPTVSEPSVDEVRGELSRTAWVLSGEQDARGEGWLVSSDHYRLYTTASPRIVDRLPRFLEIALRHYTSAMGELPLPKQPMETYFLGSRGQWERVTQRLMGGEATIYLRIERGGYSARGRSVFYDLGPRDSFVIAAHESWHQYTQSTFAEALPLAIEEGLATYMEGFRWSGNDRTEPVFAPWRNFERFTQLREAAAEGELMALEDLVVAAPQDLLARGGSGAALRYYAQVWAMIHFLNEGEGGKHRAALRTMVRDALEGRLSARISGELGERAGRSVRLGRRGIDVLGVYTGVPTSELNAAYQAFVREIVKNGSGQKIAAGESPIP